MATAARDITATAVRPANDVSTCPATEVTVVIPTFCEVGNVAAMVERLDAALSGIGWEAVFVDDDSPDGTADEVRRIARDDKRIRVIQRIGRRGLSTACLEGICAASADFAVVIDGDGQHDETLIRAMVAQRRRPIPPDVVIGSRFIDGGGTGDWDAGRVAKSAFATRLARRVSKVDMSDPMSGFFGIDTRLARSLAPSVSGIGFKILLDLVTAADRRLEIVELPYTFRTREVGESKLDHVVALEYLLSLYARTPLARLIPLRFAMFCMVGCLGLGVHMAVMWALFANGLAGFTASVIAATLTAITANFLLNNALTYSDRRLKGARAMARGWLSFAAVCGVGAIANIGAASWLHEWRDGSWELSALAGAGVAIIWNFALSGRFTWGRYR